MFEVKRQPLRDTKNWNFKPCKIQRAPLVHVPTFFWGEVAGSEDFACAALPTIPLILKQNPKYLSRYLPKNQIQDNCHPPPPHPPKKKKGQSQN